MDTTAPPTLNYLNNGHGLKSWLLTKDHKRIALLYLFSITAFFFLGGFFALMIRLELLTPSPISAFDTYNSSYMHGIVVMSSDSIDSRGAGQLSDSDHDAQDLAFHGSTSQLGIYVRRAVRWSRRFRQRGCGWTFYAPYAQRVELTRHHGGRRHLIKASSI